MKPFADQEVDASGRMEGTDQPMEYIFTLPRQWNYTNRKTEVVSGVRVPIASCRIA